MLASELVEFTATTAGGQKFGRDTLHHFCSPIFLNAMYVLFDKNIQTTSCGSGKERGILPGITGLYEKLSPSNKIIAKPLLISPTEFRIGAKIESHTTFAQFESELLKIVSTFAQQ